MPLTPVTLTTGLQPLRGPPMPSSGLEVANTIAGAYHTYASLAVCGGFPITAGAAASKMASALAPVFSVPMGAPPAVATAFGTAVTAYWTGVVFGAPGGGGPAVPPLGAPALVTALTALFSVPTQPFDTFVQQLAALLHTCTLTTTGTLTVGAVVTPLVPVV